jgi:hypothetical protein
MHLVRVAALHHGREEPVELGEPHARVPAAMPRKKKPRRVGGAAVDPSWMMTFVRLRAARPARPGEDVVVMMPVMRPREHASTG